MIRLNKTTIFGIIVFVIMLSTGIGYAFLSSNLSIDGSATVSSRKSIICKRATSLHSKTCTFDPRSDGLTCVNDGYSKGSTITFGKTGTSGTLSSGDAFDCDVNGDGSYNATSERFYYLSDLDSNSDYAVLIWYNSIRATRFNNNGFGDPLSTGPNQAYQHLPTTSSSTPQYRWSNVSLANQTRQIKDEVGKVYKNFSYILTSGSYTIIFRARLATFNEIVKACPGIQVRRGKHIKSGNCQYLVENTQYYDNTEAGLLRGYWLETVYPAKSLENATNNKVWVVDGFGHSIYPIFPVGNDSNSDSIGSYFDVRPVIEVKKGQINY